MIIIIIGFTTNQDEFLAKLPEEYKFHPYGELLHVYRKDDVQYEIYKVEYLIHEYIEIYLVIFLRLQMSLLLLLATTLDYRYFYSGS